MIRKLIKIWTRSRELDIGRERDNEERGLAKKSEMKAERWKEWIDNLDDLADYEDIDDDDE